MKTRIQNRTEHANRPINGARKPTVLVVDDIPENIDVLKDVLTSEYVVQSATIGQITKKAANVLPRPDLILPNIMVSGMNGYEVCLMLNADPATREIMS